jgi:hypothetical protein
MDPNPSMLLYMEDYRRTDRPQAGVQCPIGGVGVRLGHAERLTGAILPEAAVKRGKAPSGLEKPVEWVDGYTRSAAAVVSDCPSLAQYCWFSCLRTRRYTSHPFIFVFQVGFSWLSLAGSSGY